MVVAIAALAGAAIGWRFPFLGRSRSANQIGTSQELATRQPTNRAKTQQSRQQNLQAQNSNQANQTAQASDGTGSADTTSSQNTQGTQSNTNSPVPALW